MHFGRVIFFLAEVGGAVKRHLQKFAKSFFSGEITLHLRMNVDGFNTLGSKLLKQESLKRLWVFSDYKSTKQEHQDLGKNQADWK